MAALIDCRKQGLRLNWSDEPSGDQERAALHLRIHFRFSKIRFLYQRGEYYYYRVNEYASDRDGISRSEFVVVRVADNSVVHEIRTIRQG